MRAHPGDVRARRGRPRRPRAGPRSTASATAPSTSSGSSPIAASRSSAPGLRANLDADGRLINVGAGAQPDPRSTRSSRACRRSTRCWPRAAPPGRGRAGRRPAAAARARHRLRGRPARQPDGLRRSPRLARAAPGRRPARLRRRRRRRPAATRSTGSTSCARPPRRAFDNYPGAPLGGAQVAKTFPETGDDPWLTDADACSATTPTSTRTRTDAIDGFRRPTPPAPGDEIPPVGARAWSYTPGRPRGDLGPASTARRAGCSWNNFDCDRLQLERQPRQAGTQLFYFVNPFHDHLRDAAGIGFDDSSGNFEGADRVIAQVDDGAATDVGSTTSPPATTSTTPSSSRARRDAAADAGLPLVERLPTAADPAHDVNPADDALIVYHEYTHGMTNRLVTDAARVPGDERGPAGRHGRGLADWYALDLLNAQGFEPDTAAPGELRAGQVRERRAAHPAVRLPGGRVAAARARDAGAGSGGYTYGDFGKILGGPRCTPTGRSGWRRCGTCARA